ncbi:MAG: V-type ATP synthase subunit F [Nocardioidaceae bacterium]
MARIAAIGAGPLVRGWALAGVTVHPADTPPTVRSAWDSLAADVDIVILTAAAAEQLGDVLASSDRLTAVMPS